MIDWYFILGLLIGSVGIVFLGYSIAAVFGRTTQNNTGEKNE